MGNPMGTRSTLRTFSYPHLSLAPQPEATVPEAKDLQAMLVLRLERSGMNREQEDMRKAADLLETAADVLDTRGWTKGVLYQWDKEAKTGAYCALGALS